MNLQWRMLSVRHLFGGGVPKKYLESIRILDPELIDWKLKDLKKLGPSAVANVVSLTLLLVRFPTKLS